MSMRELAEHVGVSYGYMVQAARGHRTMGPKVRARVESALEAPVEVAPARVPEVDRHAVFARLNAHGISQNEAARRAGISSGHLSQIVNGDRVPSPGVLKRLHGVLFRKTRSEARVVPAEVKVLGWRKGERRGTVVRGAGGPGGESIRDGGRVPWGAEAEYAYRAGYDGRGDLSFDTVAVRAARPCWCGRRRWPRDPRRTGHHLQTYIEVIRVGASFVTRCADTSPI